MIKYEFPLNERIRRLIRLEELFGKTSAALTSTQKFSSYIVFERLFELMQTASRSDLKVDLMQEAERQKIKIKAKSRTKVNSQMSIKLTKLKTSLEKAKIHPGYYFGDDKFLQEIKSRNDSPYGITSVDFPEFQYWLHSESIQFQKDYLSKKLQPYYPIKDAISTLIGILRTSAETQSVTAESGVYQRKLDPALKIDLVTLIISKSMNCFPNISSNKYAISIHFNHAKKKVQLEKDIRFKLGLASL